MNRRTAVAVAVAGALLTIAAATQAFREIVPYFASGIGDRQRFEAIAGGGFAPASSKWSRDLYLNDCLEVSESIFALAQPATGRNRLLENCRGTARAVVDTTPNASNAWLVLATTSAKLDDFSTMRTALAMSRQTAPNLRWLAYRRSLLVESNIAEIDEAGVADYERDLLVLASGGEGIAALAQRYARKPRFRDTYIRVLESSLPGQKRAFLDRVKIEMAR